MRIAIALIAMFVVGLSFAQNAPNPDTDPQAQKQSSTASAAAVASPVRDWGVGEGRSFVVPAAEIAGYELLLNRFDHYAIDHFTCENPISDFRNNVDHKGSSTPTGSKSASFIGSIRRPNQVDATWPISQCEAPHGLAVDPVAHRLFSSCENQVLTVVNADTGAVVTTVAIGRGTDAAAFDPAHKLVFSSNGTDGTVTVIHEVNADTFAPVGTLTTMLSARTMSVDPQTGRLYVVGAKTTPEAMAAFQKARRSGNRAAPSPFEPGSLQLMMFDPEQ